MRRTSSEMPSNFKFEIAMPWNLRALQGFAALVRLARFRARRGANLSNRGLVAPRRSAFLAEGLRRVLVCVLRWFGFRGRRSMSGGFSSKAVNGRGL